MIGSSLSHYRITAELGAGGMGEVYRATDTKLGREVAIKVLPTAFVEDAERLARFEREAKLLAQLHHPNIASIFGLEESEGVRALIMELVEGEDLSERLARGPIPADEALEIARQIAEALEEAHEHGIVHRDLKPANVKVTPDGKVKVLDFGLAKAWAGEAASGPAADLSQSPTLAHTGTQAGVILGTAAYMSPEQARGRPVDKRADIWAFGVVLYEMLTGRRLFTGETTSDVLAGVLRQEIDLSVLPAEAPPAVQRMLRGCLERNPKNRLHDVADARLAMDAAGSARPDAPAAVVAGRRRSLAAVAALALAAGVAIGWLAHVDRARPRVDSRWALAMPDGFSLSGFDTPQIALSRDGRLQAAVVTGDDGTRRLLLRRSDEFEPRFLAGAEGAYAPFFSPDGTWVAFFRDDALLKLPVAGGPAIRLATVVTAGGRGGTWSDDGFIYFAVGYASGLSRVPESGGVVQTVTHLDAARSERTHRWPDALPGGGAVLFTSDTQASSEYYDDARIEAVRPSTGERRVLVEGASQARFAPGGHLVFARGGSLYAVAFDPGTLAVRGTPTEVVQGVATNVGSGAVQFALAESGAGLWAPGGLSASYATVWVDGSGRESPISLPPAPYQELALSPDGTRLALVGGPGGVSDLWIADLQRGGITRLTSGEFVRSPLWTPDGTRLAFLVLLPGAALDTGRIDWQVADGSRPAETLVPKAAVDVSDFTPDGRTMLFSRGANEAGTVSNLWTLDLGASRTAQALTEGDRALRAQAQLSPDGHWLAYVSDESGQNCVYVRPFPGGAGRWQVSIPGGDEPRWGPRGREIFYRYGSVLYRVTIDTSSGFKAGRPEAFLERVASGQVVHTYFLSPDGSRIVTQRTAEGSRAPRVLYLDLGFASRLEPPGR